MSWLPRSMHHRRAHADPSAPAASKRRKKSGSPDSSEPRLGEAHARFVRDVELAIDSWLESSGELILLLLPPVSTTTMLGLGTRHPVKHRLFCIPTFRRQTSH